MSVIIIDPEIPYPAHGGFGRNLRPSCHIGAGEAPALRLAFANGRDNEWQMAGKTNESISDTQRGEGRVWICDSVEEKKLLLHHIYIHTWGESGGEGSAGGWEETARRRPGL